MTTSLTFNLVTITEVDPIVKVDTIVLVGANKGHEVPDIITFCFVNVTAPAKLSLLSWMEMPTPVRI